jgi:hypothetical protein
VVVVEGGSVAMQEFAAQKEGLGQPAVCEGHQQDLAEVVDLDDPGSYRGSASYITRDPL